MSGKTARFVLIAGLVAVMMLAAGCGPGKASPGVPGEPAGIDDRQSEHAGSASTGGEDGNAGGGETADDGRANDLVLDELE